MSALYHSKEKPTKIQILLLLFCLAELIGRSLEDPGRVGWAAISVYKFGSCRGLHLALAKNLKTRENDEE